MKMWMQKSLKFFTVLLNVMLKISEEVIFLVCLELTFGRIVLKAVESRIHLRLLTSQNGEGKGEGGFGSDHQIIGHTFKTAYSNTSKLGDF